MKKTFFPKVDAASQLADNGKDVQQTGHEVVAEESASADDAGDDGKKKKKKEKVGFRDRKVNQLTYFQCVLINIYTFIDFVSVYF
jgi:hypothetical protein